MLLSLGLRQLGYLRNRAVRVWPRRLAVLPSLGIQSCALSLRRSDGVWASPAGGLVLLSLGLRQLGYPRNRAVRLWPRRLAVLLSLEIQPCALSLRRSDGVRDSPAGGLTSNARSRNLQHTVPCEVPGSRCTHRTMRNRRMTASSTTPIVPPGPFQSWWTQFRLTSVAESAPIACHLQPTTRRCRRSSAEDPFSTRRPAMRTFDGAHTQSKSSAALAGSTQQ